MALVEQNMGFFEMVVDFFMDYVVFPIQHITIVNILDIALLTVLIYVVYKFIRDRNASRALIGFNYARLARISAVQALTFSISSSVTFLANLKGRPPLM